MAFGGNFVRSRLVMMKILHVLETSIPHTVGYTIRARSIVENQRRAGMEPVVVTSPFFPSKLVRAAVEELDGVLYYRTNHIRAPGSARTKVGSYLLRLMMVARYRRAVLDIAIKERPDVIHAHSSYTNAYAALPAARRLGIPLVYEVRTLWGESAVVEDGLRADSPKHRLIWKLELGAMRRADVVVPISRGIREELIARGIAPEKLEVVPNGVDTERFKPVPRDTSRARGLGLEGSFVIGFLGSIRKLEGIVTLLEAYKLCQERRADVALVIVGDGPERPLLEARARQLGLKSVVFPGNVPHEEVASWYSIMDLMVYPRIRAVINERVTPLKPLEAMALGKVCVGSDVGGLLELIRNDETGMIFRSGDHSDLAAVVLALIDDPGRMERLRGAAFDFIKREREWSSIVERYREIYAGRVGAKRGGAMRGEEGFGPRRQNG